MVHYYCIWLVFGIQHKFMLLKLQDLLSICMRVLSSGIGLGTVVKEVYLVLSLTMPTSKKDFPGKYLL